MPAQQEEIRAALAEGIQLHELVIPLSIRGTEEATVHSIYCQRMQLDQPDEKGRRRPIPLPGDTFLLPADVILVAIGEAPDPSFLPEGTSIEVAPWGGLLINHETMATGAPGVFAAGDVTYGPKTIIHAAAHGRQAARSIHAYLRKHSPRDMNEMPDDTQEIRSPLSPNTIINVDLRPTPRAIMPLRSGQASTERSVEFATGFTEEQAQHEASRCLRCDLAYRCPTIHVISPETIKRAQPVHS
jgi:NADPH-dependent glutamate synthase beta subunit-like oxidoreductase